MDTTTLDPVATFEGAARGHHVLALVTRARSGAGKPAPTEWRELCYDWR
jgi:hypothetical protein